MDNGKKPGMGLLIEFDKKKKMGDQSQEGSEPQHNSGPKYEDMVSEFRGALKQGDDAGAAKALKAFVEKCISDQNEEGPEGEGS